MTLAYTSTRIRLQDYLRRSGQVTLRLQVNNPRYFTPGWSEFRMQLNPPLRECVLTVDPKEGYELQTRFKISVTGCEQGSSPLVYTFFHYRSEEHK
jgi:hypothetical protein